MTCNKNIENCGCQAELHPSKDVMNRLFAALSCAPTLRLGQLINNAITSHVSLARPHNEQELRELVDLKLFYAEDGELVTIVEDFVRRATQPVRT